jgi:ATP-binding cassette subfamily B protein
MNRWWAAIGRYALPFKGQIAAVALLLLSYSVFEALRPWPLKLIVDNVLAGQPLPSAMAWLHALPGGAAKLGLLGWLTAGTVVIFLAGWGAKLAQTYLQAGLGARMNYRLGADVFDHLQRLSLRFHASQRVGDLTQRVMSDSACARELVASVALPLLTSVVTLAMMIVVVFRLNPFLATIAVAAIPPLYLLIRYLSDPMSHWEYRKSELQGELMSRAEQVLTAIPVVQAFGQEQREQDRFDMLTRNSGRAYVRSIGVQLQFKVGVGAVLALSTALLMYLGGGQALGGKMSLGDLLVFLAYLEAFYAPLASLAYLSQGYAFAAAGARRVLEMMAVQDQVEQAAAPVRLAAACRGEVGFEGVSFGYESNRPVLQDVNFTAAAGERIAIVGASGAGKSTLVSLVPRLFDPWSGRVTLDGVDVRKLALPDLRSRIGMLLQEPYLQAATVAENIAFGRPGASRAQIIAAAEAANADAFIRRLPRGYDTEIGERGVMLSGGERQRLAIARALLRDAPVLILDEPTSALDAATEDSLMEALERLMAGRTTLLIAHRLSTARRADRIVVLEGGRIVTAFPDTAELAVG